MYSHQSGCHNFPKYIPFIKERLMGRFDRVDFRCSLSIVDAKDIAIESSQKYDVLVICGGDGTFNNIINAIAPLKRKPILGYLNFGTIGDIGRNFGISKNLNKALDIIANGDIVDFDVGEINGKYFAYVCTIGRYSDIAYLTPRRKKRVLGKVAYYNAAIKELRNKKVVHATIEADDGHYEFDTPFILLLNGMNIGGFKVNRYCSINDGKMELFLAKKDFSNGLLPILINRNRVVLQAHEFFIHTDEEMSWCLDGEEGPKGDIHILTHEKMFKIFAKKGSI